MMGPFGDRMIQITVGVIDGSKPAGTRQLTIRFRDFQRWMRSAQQSGLRIEQINKNEGKAMAAGAAMAVVGWWTGYKLGGVISLFVAEYFENMGIEDYWQTTFIVLGALIILMNIGLMFVHESSKSNRLKNQKLEDKKIKRDLNSTKKKNLIFLGAFFVIISLLQILPDFQLTKDIFPFLFLFISN